MKPSNETLQGAEAAALQNFHRWQAICGIVFWIALAFVIVFGPAQCAKARRIDAETDRMTKDGAP